MMTNVAGRSQRAGRSSMNRASIPSDLSRISDVAQDILSLVQDLGYGDEAMFAIALAVDEALSNAIEHGNGDDPSKQVHVQYKVTGTRTYISIQDEGAGFDPNVVPDATLDECLELPCGRGIMLMRACMDEVWFNKEGNEVRMIKINDPHPPDAWEDGPHRHERGFASVFLN